MRLTRVALFMVCTFSVICALDAARAPHMRPQRVSVCQLSHLGASSDGKRYETHAVYSTTYRHGAYLMSRSGPHCVIQLGARQNDVDSSVARFDETLLRTKARHGMAAERAVTVALVFHWVKNDSGEEFDAFGQSPGARGVVELRKVLGSAYYNHPD